ncbi:MAG TPA: hypothetical protein VG929_09855 [Actinomycetota bacterium]|nr:hypothetical protein [Actinomycetota bacterium]
MAGRRTAIGGCLFFLVASIAGCTSGGQPAAAPTPEVSFTPDAPPAPAEELLYVEGRTLKVYDLAEGSIRDITELPSADVAVSPDGRLLVAVREAGTKATGDHQDQGAGGHEDEGHEGQGAEGEGAEGEGGDTEDPEGFGEPEVVIASTEGPEDPSVLGPGRSPVWGPNSASLAVIAPAGEGEAIHVYQLPGSSRQTASPTDELWSIVGWQGTDIVAIGSRSGPVAISSLGDEVKPLDVPAIELWGVSPASVTHLRVSDEGARLEGAIEGSIGGLEGGTLGNGTWSWDGTRIASAAISDGGVTSLVVINTRTRGLRQVRGSRGAQGNVVWSVGNDRFAYVRVDQNDRSRLEAVVCTVELECDELFNWARGVRLLAFR